LLAPSQTCNLQSFIFKLFRIKPIDLYQYQGKLIQVTGVEAGQPGNQLVLDLKRNPPGCQQKILASAIGSVHLAVPLPCKYSLA